MGLKTGWGDNGYITAAIVGFALFAALGRRTGYSRLENNITQTAASSAAGMPFTVGIVTAFPAFALLGRHHPGWAIAVWGLLVAVVGTLIAVPLRQPLIVEEKL